MNTLFSLFTIFFFSYFSSPFQSSPFQFFFLSSSFLLTSSTSSTTIMTTMKMAAAESKFDQKSGWLSKILNFYSKDAKVVFSAVTVSMLFKSFLADLRSIPWCWWWVGFGGCESWVKDMQRRWAILGYRGFGGSRCGSGFGWVRGFWLIWVAGLWCGGGRWCCDWWVCGGGGFFYYICGDFWWFDVEFFLGRWIFSHGLWRLALLAMAVGAWLLFFLVCFKGERE